MSFSRLFTPHQVRGLEIGNRIYSTGYQTIMAENGSPGERTSQLGGQALLTQLLPTGSLRKIRRLTQCGRHCENGQGLTKNITSGGSDCEGICVGDNLCFHHS